MNLLKNFIVICLLTGILSILSSLELVPPHPLKSDGIELFEKQFKPAKRNRGLNPRSTPDSVLVLLVQFQDVTFDLVADYPDYLAHDLNYFRRTMLHLSDYFYDNSYGQYELKDRTEYPNAEATYHVYEEIITLPENMGYYGEDNSSESIARFALDTVNDIDSEIDFNNYDSFILFHAGAGQESDLDKLRFDELWSTFLSISDLQEGLDPENENYQGIFADGKYLKEFIVAPESEWQPYFDESRMILGILGVITHQFGHQLGLPTLFDNVSSSIHSDAGGIGDFGLMGTGSWNANGYVPPKLCGWSRYYLGWEQPEEYNSGEDLELQVEYSHLNATQPTLYKLNISDKEYFLLENLQQNPDQSTTTWKDTTDAGVVYDDYTEQSFTFALVDNQQYYPYPNNHVPRFVYMENRYRGCEWNFYTPGLGGPDTPTDGSGMLIWHIDENIIDATFDPDFVNNHPNGNASHKGVDLEEADVIQDMDHHQSMYWRGSPEDSYRAGNNDYFGKPVYPNSESPSYPTAESYYGGIMLEVTDISEAATTMSFIVNFEWSLSCPNYDGENFLPAARVDLNGNGIDEILYPMAGLLDESSETILCFWEEEEESQVILNHSNTVLLNNVLYTYDPQSNSLFIPSVSRTIEQLGITKVHKLDNEYIQETEWNYTGFRWANSLVYDIESQTNFIGLNLDDSTGCAIKQIDSDLNEIASKSFDNIAIASNFILFNHFLYVVTWSAENEFQILKINTGNLNDFDFMNTEFQSESKIIAFQQSPFDNENSQFSIMTNSGEFCLLDEDFNLKENFPIVIPMHAYSEPTIADVDKNGYLDFVVTGENRVALINYNGSYILNSIDTPDSLGISAGALVFDIDGDNENEIITSLSQKRLVVMNKNLDIQRGYPISFGAQSRVLPLLYEDNEGEYAVIPTDNGTLYRDSFNFTDLDINSVKWQYNLGNLQRTAAYGMEIPQNTFKSNSVFVKDEVYIFPNPAGPLLGNKLLLNVMTSENTEISLKICDIAGNELLDRKLTCYAYLNNRQNLGLNFDRLSSGIYFAKIKAENEIKKIKFAVEK